LTVDARTEYTNIFYYLHSKAFSSNKAYARENENIQKRRALWARLFLWLSVIAAAKNDNDSKDDDPSAVVIKKMAEAVVIHYVFLREFS
jgi:hypothetical protein